MKVGAESTYAGGQCGIGIWQTFKYVPEEAEDYKYNSEPNTNYWGWMLNESNTSHQSYVRKLNKNTTKGGCGFNGTGFIDTRICKDAYNQLCKDFRLIFQTPVRKNANSGNMFFYAMFDNTEEKDMKHDDLPTLQLNWPF